MAINLLCFYRRLVEQQIKTGDFKMNAQEKFNSFEMRWWKVCDNNEIDFLPEETLNKYNEIRWYANGEVYGVEFCGEDNKLELLAINKGEPKNLSKIIHEEHMKEKIGNWDYIIKIRETRIRGHFYEVIKIVNPDRPGEQKGEMYYGTSKEEAFKIIEDFRHEINCWKRFNLRCCSTSSSNQIELKIPCKRCGKILTTGYFDHSIKNGFTMYCDGCYKEIDVRNNYPDFFSLEDLPYFLKKEEREKWEEFTYKLCINRNKKLEAIPTSRRPAGISHSEAYQLRINEKNYDLYVVAYGTIG